MNRFHALRACLHGVEPGKRGPKKGVYKFPLGTSLGLVEGGYQEESGSLGVINELNVEIEMPEWRQGNVMKKLYITALAVGVALGAQGAFVIEVDTFGPNLTDFTDTVTLKKFDPNLGELVRVTYTLDGTIAGEITADSENPVPRNVTLTVAGTISVKDGGSTRLEVSSSTSSGIVPLAADNEAGGFPDYVGTDATTFPAVNAESDSVSAVDAATLSWFTATFLDETFSWDIDAKGMSEATGSGNLAVLVQQYSSGTVTVRYEYNTAVPEAGTYLSGLGLLGMAAFAVRRMRRR